MILQPASRKEVRRVAAGTGVLDILLIAGLFLLSQFGIGTFDLISILLGILGGSVIAVVNFAFLCFTVQQAVGIEDKKKMQAKFQLSYNIRMVVQAGWVVICFFVPWLHIFAGALPLLFPKVTILYLNAKGKLIPKEERAPDNSEASEPGETELPE